MDTNKQIIPEPSIPKEANTNIDEIWQMLSHQDFLIRQKGVRNLVKISNISTVERLIKILNEDSYVRGWAAWALSKIGSDEAITELGKALKNEEQDVRCWAVWALAEIGSDAAVCKLLYALYHPDYEVRWRAITGLGRIFEKPSSKDDREVLNHLLKTVKDEDYYVRSRAIAAIGKLRAKVAVPILSQALYDPEFSVRYRAAEALEKIGDSEAVSALMQALQHDDSDVRSSVIYSLAQVNSQLGIDSLLKALRDPESKVRAKAAEVLGKFKSNEVINALLEALLDEDFYVRWRAASALGEIGSEQAINGLVEALKDKNPCVRGAAASALGQIGSKSALSGLWRSIKDKDYYVSKRVAIALKKITAKSVASKMIANQSQQSNLPNILITSYGEAGEHILCPNRGPLIKHLISIASPGVDLPEGYTNVPHRLRLEFDDIDIPHNDPEYVLATPEHIRKVINFVSEVSELNGHILIHCQAGISRSSAVALTVCAQLLGAGKEKDAMEIVMKARPQAMPNLWVVELADDALGRGGKLLEVAQGYQG
ncbi:MAG TPA: HEAT repeat domain-containing protein [Leptolyngbyaceae cyanobacterium]